MNITTRFLLALFLMGALTWFFAEFVNKVVIFFISLTENGEFISWLLLHVFGFAITVYVAVLTLEDE